MMSSKVLIKMLRFSLLKKESYVADIIYLHSFLYVRRYIMNKSMVELLLPTQYIQVMSNS